MHAISTALKFFPLLAIELDRDLLHRGGDFGAFAANGLGTGDRLLGGSPRGDAHAAFIHGGS